MAKHQQCPAEGVDQEEQEEREDQVGFSMGLGSSRCSLPLLSCADSLTTPEGGETGGSGETENMEHRKGLY